jgi:Zn-dependent M28 family amino/carboxypeptidase
VCGFWPGSDPELSKEVIIVSAHYDHVGVGSDGQIYNGADDNGSGTCGLLALAEALANYGPLKRSVMLMWVSGEEKGLLGSAAWTKDPWLPPGCKAICDINIDMIGRNAPDKLLITPTKAKKEYNGLVKLAEKLAPLEGFPELGSCDDYWERSDHRNFSVNLEIPVTFLFSDVHEDYHKPGDDPDKIDFDKIRRVVRLVLRMIDAMQEKELNLG